MLLSKRLCCWKKKHIHN